MSYQNVIFYNAAVFEQRSYSSANNYTFPVVFICWIRFRTKTPVSIVQTSTLLKFRETDPLTQNSDNPVLLNICVGGGYVFPNSVLLNICVGGGSVFHNPVLTIICVGGGYVLPNSGIFSLKLKI